jgi:tRNA-dihydrouridine synthase A
LFDNRGMSSSASPSPATPPTANVGHAWRVSVAPMMDWTDRHCRLLHRLLSRHTRLYTEMVTTGALLHGDVPRHLDFHEVEHPVALQLGGSEPADLAACARLAERWGYDEVNLNCGCPSERVQRGAFGACLMAEPELVADGVAAMRDASASIGSRTMASCATSSARCRTAAAAGSSSSTRAMPG